MIVGEKLIRTPRLYTTFGHRDGVPQECVVISIHPRRRFYTVEFTSKFGQRFRQSYYFEDRRGTAGEKGQDYESDSDYE